MTPSQLLPHAAEAMRHHGLGGAFRQTGTLVHYERQARDRESDVAPALEALACRLEDDGWNLVREYAPAHGRMPRRLDFLRLTSLSLPAPGVPPWDDREWILRGERLEKERAGRRVGTGSAPNAKTEGAWQRAVASREAVLLEWDGDAARMGREEERYG